MNTIASAKTPGTWRRAKLVSGGVAISVAALVMAALPASASAPSTAVVTSNFTIGSPTGAVTNINLSANPTTAGATNANYTLSFTEGSAVSSGGTFSVSLSNPSTTVNFGTLGSTATLYDVTAGWLQSVSLTGNLNASGTATYSGTLGHAIGANDTLELIFTAGNPGTAGSYTLNVATSANATTAATNSITISAGPTAASVSPTTAPAGQTEQFTLSNYVPTTATGYAAASYIDVWAIGTTTAGSAVAWQPGAYTITDKTSGGTTTTSTGTVTVVANNSTTACPSTVTGGTTYCSQAVLGFTNSVTFGATDTVSVSLPGIGPSGAGLNGVIDTYALQPATATAGTVAANSSPTTTSGSSGQTQFGTTVTGVVATPSTNTAGASGNYTVTFKATTALTAATGNITISEANTTFSGVSGFIADDTTSNAAPSASGVACTGGPPPTNLPCFTASANSIVIWPDLAISAGDSVTVTLIKVTNPSAGSISDFYVKTSTDPVNQPAAAFTIAASSSTTVTNGVTVTASPSSQGALSTWTLSNLVASAALTGGTSTIEISGNPGDSNCTTCSGLVFPNLASDYSITDATTPADSGTVTATPVNGGTNDVIITVPKSIASGDHLTLTIADVINPSSGTATANLAIGAGTATTGTVGTATADLTTNGMLAAATVTLPIFPGANVTYPNAAIVNFGGTFYSFAGGHAFGCATPAQLIGVQAVDHALVQTAAVGSTVPSSTARPGTLIVVQGTGTIYVVGTDGDLHGFATPTQFLQSGYDSALVITVCSLGGMTVSTSTVGQLGAAANALSTSSDGAIVNDSGTFYIFAGGRAFGIATPAQLMSVQAGNYTSAILSGSISSAAMTAPIGNGVVVTLNGTVYVSNSGELFAFKAMSQLSADGYGGTPSIIIPNFSGATAVTTYSGS